MGVIPVEMDITELNFKLRAKDMIRLPEHPGSTIRGALGHGLYNVCCSLRNNSCEKCNLRSNCAYSLLFNPFLAGKEREDSSTRFYNKPRPFIIRSKSHKKLYEKEDTIEFSIILYGYLKNFIPFIIESWRYLEQVGLGANRGKFQLEEVWQTNGIEGSAKRIYSWQDNIIHNCDIAVTGHDIEVYSRHFKGKDKITISLETPALLKYNKDFVDRVDFHIFIQNLYRRLSSLSYFYGSKRLELDFNDCIDRARNIDILTEETKWLQWERLSNRQGRKIAMYGLIGEITYSGELDEFIEYLVWGQYTGIGKNTTFGQGVYRIR